MILIHTKLLTPLHTVFTLHVHTTCSHCAPQVAVQRLYLGVVGSLRPRCPGADDIATGGPGAAAAKDCVMRRQKIMFGDGAVVGFFITLVAGEMACWAFRVKDRAARTTKKA